MRFQYIFYGIIFLTIGSSSINLHYDKYLYDNDWSRLCAKRVIPSVYLANRATDANAQQVHFAQTDLPYSCSISVKSEPGNVIILVIQVSTEGDLARSCQMYNSQMLVYNGGETFGGYWGHMWKEDVAYTTNQDHYYGITSADEADTEIDEVIPMSYEYTKESTTESTTDTTDDEFLEVILPIVNISIELNKTDTVFNKPFDLDVQEKIIFNTDSMPDPRDSYYTTLLPIATFSLDYRDDDEYIENEIISTATSPPPPPVTGKPREQYHYETKPADIQNYTIDIFKPRSPALVTGRKYHLSITSRRPYYQKKKIVTSSLESLIFRTNTQTTCGESCRSSTRTVKNKQQEDEVMRDYLRQYIKTLSVNDGDVETYFGEVSSAGKPQAALEKQPQSGQQAPKTIKEIENKLKLIDEMIEVPKQDNVNEQDYDFSTEVISLSEDFKIYAKGNDSIADVIHNTKDDVFSIIFPTESIDTSTESITTQVYLPVLHTKESVHYKSGNESVRSSILMKMINNLTPRSHKRKKKPTTTTISDSEKTPFKNKNYYSGNDSFRYDLYKSIYQVPPGSIEFKTALNMSSTPEEPTKKYTSGLDSLKNVSEEIETSTGQHISKILPNYKLVLNTAMEKKQLSTSNTINIPNVHHDFIKHDDLLYKTLNSLVNDNTKLYNTTKSLGTILSDISKPITIPNTSTTTPDSDDDVSTRRVFLHYKPTGQTVVDIRNMDYEQAWQASLGKVTDKNNMVNRKSWENVVQVVPNIAKALNLTKSVNKNITKERKGAKSKKRNKRSIHLVRLSHRKPNYMNKYNNSMASTLEYPTVTIDPNKFAEFIELDDQLINDRVNLSDYSLYTDKVAFNICDYEEPKIRQVFMINSTSRIVIVLNNFTIDRMSLVMTSATVIRNIIGRCPPETLECQVAGSRVCIDSSHACDGIPNCAASDIYDEDRILCGALTPNVEYDVYVAAFTLLALLLTLLYAMHYWLNRCVPKVSDAFFVYRDGIENMLYLGTIMKSPDHQSDESINKNPDFERFLDIANDHGEETEQQNKKFKLNCIKKIKNLFQRKKVEKPTSMEMFQREDREMYSFALSEIDKIIKVTQDCGTQTGGSLELEIDDEDTFLHHQSSNNNDDDFNLLQPEMSSELSILKFIKRAKPESQRQMSIVTQQFNLRNELEVSNYVYDPARYSIEEPSTSSVSDSAQAGSSKVPMKRIRFEETSSDQIGPRRKAMVMLGNKTQEMDPAEEEDEVTTFKRFWTGMKKLPRKKSHTKK